MQNYFISKIFNLLKIIIFNIKILFSLAFWKYLISLKKFKNKNNKNIFIFDNFEVLNNTLFRAIYLVYISKLLECKLFYINYKFNPIFKMIYSRIGSDKLNINLNVKQKEEHQTLLDDFFLKSVCKKDILDYEIDQINIGLDIYESYLIKYKQPTIKNINIRNNELYLVVSNALKYFIFWRDFIKLNKNRIKGVLLSHRNYIETNILNRLSIINQINVYTLTGDGKSILRWKNTNLNFFKHYQDIFETLDSEEKKTAINWSQDRLKLRFDGGVGVDMPYSTKSAYASKNQTYQISNSPRIKILICSSCFFDNPHCYGKMMFEDFYESLKFLGKISQETEYDWYLKPHPDYLPGTIEILNECKSFFSNLEIISEHTSFHNLKNQIDYAITSYGSIGHELPLLGIPVINCSNINPHQTYKFNFTPKNKTDLEYTLKNLNSIKISRLEDIYKFYFVHYKFFEPSDLIDKFFFNDVDDSNKINLEKINDYCYLKKNLNIIANRLKKFLQFDEFITSEDRLLAKLKKIDNVNFNEKIF